MTNDQSGSGSGGDDAQALATGQNKTAKAKMDEAFAKVEVLERQHQDDAKLVDELTKQLKEVNDVVDGERKAKKIGWILANSSYRKDDLVSKSNDDLDGVIATLKQAKLPKVNNVRFGFTDNKNDKDTIGDLSYDTRMRRKAQEGN